MTIVHSIIEILSLLCVGLTPALVGAPRSTYVLEVGLALGATNLTINMPSAATEYAVAVAPAVTYYVKSVP